MNYFAKLPTFGLLLLILALGVFAWPRLQSFRSMARSVPDNIGDFENSASIVEAPLQSSSLQAKSDEQETSPIAESLEITPEMQDWLSIIIDYSLRLSKREMPAYWKLLEKTNSVSFTELRAASETEGRFNEFFRSPSSIRGKLYSMQVTARRISKYDVPLASSTDAKQVYEIWCTTEKSRSWLYVLVTDQLPPGVDENSPVPLTMDFAGYFFKILSYQPNQSPPNAKPLSAPMLIGQLQIPEFKNASTPVQLVSISDLWILGIVILVVAFGILRWKLVARVSPKKNILKSSASQTENLAWLESQSEP